MASSLSSSSSSSSKDAEAADVPNNLPNIMEYIPWDCDLICLVRDYLEQHGKMAFDEGDEKGRTPLMMACLHGNKEVVEYLLELGASVNTECTQLRNTPLHYTCLCYREVDAIPDIHSMRHFIDDDDALVDTTIEGDKVAIAELLLNHGAVYKVNSLGLTPICYAGLHQNSDLVNMLGEWKSNGGTVNEERIKGLEFLGVSYAIRSAICEYSPHACSCMLEARQLHPGGVVKGGNDRNSEVRDLFKRNECCSVEDLKAIKNDKEGIEIEGFLMGARIIPDEVKPRYFWNALLAFAVRSGDLAKTCSIISFIVNLGYASTELSSHKILTSLRRAISKTKSYSHNLSGLNHVMTLCFNDLSSTCAKVDDRIRHNTHDAVVETLTEAAFISCGDSFEVFTTTVIRILKLTREVKPHTDAKRESQFFPASIMLHILSKKISKGGFGELEDDVIHRIKLAFSHLLSLDNDASSRTRTGDLTLLHRAVMLWNCKDVLADKEFELILSIIRMIIRHGCPVNARDQKGYTAEDFVLKRIKERYTIENNVNIGLVRLRAGCDNPQKAAILEALRIPLSVLTLEELAARVVLKWKIPYRDHLPSKLHKIVPGF